MRNLVRRSVTVFVVCFLCFLGEHANAQLKSMGFKQLPQPGGGQVTVFYPSSDAETVIVQGPFLLSWAADGAPLKLNGRLVVISHGSGGSPWVHADLARALVERGFVVALPQHHGDNYLDPSEPGPGSWRKRPQEVSAAIDAIAGYAPFVANLSLDAVGVFGGSAGGHTALSLAGGLWSEQGFRDHCEKYIEQDFSSCVGFLTLLNGNALDRVKIWFARKVIATRFRDRDLQHYVDPRIKAAVAMVPFAADFVTESLAQPKIALGLIIADKDVNQVPRFHAEKILEACAPRCELVMRLPDASHGAMLSPMPPLAAGSIGEKLLSDPPSFDRDKMVPEINRRVVDFFVRHLVVAPNDGNHANDAVR
jgi:predicted dienelactone hydrolase